MKKNLIRKKILNLRKKKYNINYKINSYNLIKILKKNKNKNIRVGGYYPVNYEIDCLDLLKNLEKKNFTICLPAIKKRRQMEFYNWSSKDPLFLNKYGIPEPKLQKKILPDVLLIPTVGYDSYRNRIGYGGGYYDRYIERLKKKKNVLLIGFAFSFQKVNRLPVNVHDKKLDLILTEKSIIR